MPDVASEPDQVTTTGAFPVLSDEPFRTVQPGFVAVGATRSRKIEAEVGEDQFPAASCHWTHTFLLPSEAGRVHGDDGAASVVVPATSRPPLVVPEFASRMLSTLEVASLALRSSSTSSSSVAGAPSSITTSPTGGSASIEMPAE